MDFKRWISNVGFQKRWISNVGFQAKTLDFIRWISKTVGFQRMSVVGVKRREKRLYNEAINNHKD